MTYPFFNKNHFVWFILAFVLLFGYGAFITAPHAYPAGSSVSIPTGSTVKEAARILKDAGAIRSVIAFSIIVKALHSKGGVLANTYGLPEKENTFSLAYRLTHGYTGIEPLSITIPEGLNSREIGELLAIKLTNFDTKRFAVLAKDEEGYLFPDTYYFLPDTTPETVIEVMRENFNTHVQPLEEEIRLFGKSVHEVVTMASLLEREARKPDTRKMIADILWRRIELGMPLQVDAVFGYIFGQSGYRTTLEDLSTTSPYNTYLNRGLPPGPIANPGVEAIRAAIEPTANQYLYYLTGSDGRMYYAKTFEQHVANRVHLR